MKGKLVYIAISACISIILCRYHFHPLVIFISVVFFIFIIKKGKRNLFFYCLLSHLLFICLFTVVDFQNNSSLTSGKYSTIGSFTTIPSIDGDQFKGYLKSREGEKLVFFHRIKSLEQKEKLLTLPTSSICSFSGELISPKKPTIPNGFNYQQYLYDQHVHWQFKVEEIKHCKQGEISLYSYLLDKRKNGLSFIEDHFPESSVGIVQALLFGERKMIDKEIRTAYQELGIVHLLAISGLHVGVLTGGLYYLLLFFGLTHEKTRFFILILLPMYIILTGAAPSVIRASFMVALYLLLKLLKVKRSPVDVISVTLLIVLCINPYYLFHIGFQLSYVISYGLILSYFLTERFQSRISQLVVTSLLAQMICAPLLLFYFYELSLLSLPMNILFVPLYSFIILPLAILITFLLMLIPSISFLLISLYSELLQYVQQFVIYMSSIPGATITTGKPHPFLTIGHVLSTIYVLLQYERLRVGRNLVYPAVCATLILFLYLVAPYLNTFGRVVVLDVGQGDSIFIQTPFNRGKFLIDTGGLVNFNTEDWKDRSNSYSIARDMTVPYFKSIGVKELDALFLTHGDYDHIGEAIALMDEIKIKKLIIPIGFVRSQFEKKIIESALKKDIEVKVVKANDRIYFSDLIFYVLSPKTNTDSSNDDSLILWTELGGLKWLFTGDAEVGSEEQLIRHFPLLQVDVLKVGHHGSNSSTSETLLNHINPTRALVSAGLNNRYNHPHPEVVKRLNSKDIKLFRTDLHGTILYQFNKNNGTFSIHPPYDEVKK